MSKFDSIGYLQMSSVVGAELYEMTTPLYNALKNRCDQHDDLFIMRVLNDIMIQPSNQLLCKRFFITITYIKQKSIVSLTKTVIDGVRNTTNFYTYSIDDPELVDKIFSHV